MFSLLSGEKRSGKQCRERWHNHLNPDINKSDWSIEEKKKLIELHETFGNCWSKIAENLPGRTDNSVKNCFYSLIRKNLRKFNRNKPESEKIKGSIKELLKRPKFRNILLEIELPSCSDEENIQTGEVEIVRPQVVSHSFSTISSPTAADFSSFDSDIFGDQICQYAYNLYMMSNKFNKY